MTDASQDTDAKEELIEFMIHLPDIERITQIKIEMSRSNREELNRQFQKGVIRAETFEHITRVPLKNQRTRLEHQTLQIGQGSTR